MCGPSIVSLSASFFLATSYIFRLKCLEDRYKSLFGDSGIDVRSSSSDSDSSCDSDSSVCNLSAVAHNSPTDSSEEQMRLDSPLCETICILSPKWLCTVSVVCLF